MDEAERARESGAVREKGSACRGSMWAVVILCAAISVGCWALSVALEAFGG